MVNVSKTSIEEAGTNVYADLGYADATEMQRKAALAAEILRCIKLRQLDQAEAARLSGIDQHQLSRIVRGKFRDISEQKMLQILAKLEHDGTITSSNFQASQTDPARSD